MTVLARLLDALAVGLGGLGLAILATGGLIAGPVRLTCAEDIVVALAAVVGLRAMLVPIRIPHVRPDRAVAVGVVAYCVLMSFIVVSRHLALRTALDLGYYVQVVWSVSGGHGAYVTLPPMHAWGDHLSPVLYAFVPFAFVLPGAVPLLVGQTAILGAGAFALFPLASTRLRDWRSAAALALLYLVNPSLHGINIRDIHPQAFVIPLVLGAALAYERGRPGWCVAALALTLGTREDAAVAVVGFGVWLAAARGRWRLGALTAGAAIAVLAIDLALVMPYFRGEAYPHLHRYAHLGGSPGEILTTLVVRPRQWMAVVFEGPKILYLGAMLVPLGFLPLLAPRTLAAAVPGIAMNVLSVDPILFHHRTQYQAFVLPFLILAAIDGLRRLRAWTRRRHGSARRTSPAAALGLAFVASVMLTSRTVNDLMVTRWLLDREQRAAHRLMGEIPGAAVVSTNERLVPHLAMRREVYIFPTGVARSEYVLEHATRAVGVPPAYRMLVRDGPWILFRRE